MAAFLGSMWSFETEVIPEDEFYIKIGHAISYILNFWKKLKRKNWSRYGSFKIWHTFWPSDPVPWPTFLIVVLAGAAE